MTRWMTSAEGLATLALLMVGVLALGWMPAPTPELEALAGSGPVTFGLLWSCGLCVGRAALVASSGMAGVVGFLALSTNLVKLTACAGACVAALTT